ncbi:polysaccharide deacetylase family protein [Haladaptatus sp. CMAA 1911]|uniref:polysaccharide deacetylase family protein n=1 Tax=unclassified Haladaptatus TaxID=2622732 RepID=UPI0037552E13
MVGVITISLEIELGWGYHDMGYYNRFSENRYRETKTLQRLLEACDELNIPLTFDVVGHLLEKQLPSQETPHREGWWDSIPSGCDSLFFAPDIVQAIQDSNTNHEICSHTYSHVLCKHVSNRVLEWELQRANEVHQKIGEPKPVSLVPPRHSPPSKEVLKKSDVEIIRRLGYESAPTRLHKFNQLVFSPPDPIEPQLVDEIVETYCTKYSTLSAASLPSGAEQPLFLFRSIPTSIRQWFHRRYLERAVLKVIRQDSYIHLWSHLHNIANDEQWSPIRSFLEIVAHWRDRGDLVVMPMSVLNKHIRAQPSGSNDQS